MDLTPKDFLRNAILEHRPPEYFALQTIQDAIKPTRQTKLVQDENQLLENLLRSLLQEFVTAAVQSSEAVMRYGQSIDTEENSSGLIPCLLDFVLYLCEKEHVEGGMIFQLLEDLTEMSTIKNCKDVFGYIECKKDILGKQELFARGKLVMLRTCNQLLRRLSKANDVVFCGRILMFLAHFFPLSERSAVNIKGVSNLSNETRYESAPPAGSSFDFSFYKTFWSLQEYFCNPSSLAVSSKWQKFSSSLKAVLETFEAQLLTEEEGDASIVEEDATTFNMKYLTSSKLMGLELKDSSFRRHILVQCLIAFDYLKAPGKNNNDLLPDGMAEEVNSLEDHVRRLLELTPPNGKVFLHKVEHLLEREKNWVWWKHDGCPAYEKYPTEPAKVQEEVKKRKPRWRLGNKDLAQLWKWADQHPNALTDPVRVRTPSVTEYWKPLAEDMDPSAGLEDEYHHKNNRVYCWKGLRLSARQDLEGFSRFTEYGIEGVVPLELLPPDVRSKFQAKPVDRAKRARKEDVKVASAQDEETQGVTEADCEGTKAGIEALATPMEVEATGTSSNGALPGVAPTGTIHPEAHDSALNASQEGSELQNLETEAEAGVADNEEANVQ